MTLALALAGVVLVAGTASAQDNLPPDNAGIDEYTESVPGAGGDKPSDEIRQGGGGGDSSGGGDGGPGAALPADVADQFEQAGAEGSAAAGLAQATAPERARESGPGGSGGPTHGSGANDPDNGGGGFAGIVDSVVDDDGGMGIVLPIILGATLLAAVLFLFSRRRNPGEPGGA